MITILMILAKMVTLGLLKINEIKYFWKKGYDFKASAHDVTKKVLSCDSNYTADEVMWRKFGSSRVPMRKVTIA